MKIAVFGTGTVGLVTASGFAEAGHEVVCVDRAVDRIAMLRSGMIPIFEPGLDDEVERNRDAGRLRFTTEIEGVVVNSDLLILAMPAPLGDDGHVDLRAYWAAGKAIAEAMFQPRAIVLACDLPVGTNRRLARLIASHTRIPAEVVTVPEFLRDGSALADFRAPARLIFGADDRRGVGFGRIKTLYASTTPGDREIRVMSPESAELTAHASAAFEAARIAVLNEVALIASAVGGRIDDIRDGLGLDADASTLGAGYGDPRLTRDLRALAETASEAGVLTRVLPACEAANHAQKGLVGRQILDHFEGDLMGRTVAVWGLASRPGTDDLRHSPALVLIEQLLDAGAQVRVCDPQALDHARSMFGDRLIYCNDPYDAARGAHALALVTAWPEYARPDFRRLGQAMAARTLFDGRDALDAEFASFHGFRYHGVGRPALPPERVAELHGPHFSRPAPAWTDADADALNPVLSVA